MAKIRQYLGAVLLSALAAACTPSGSSPDPAGSSAQPSARAGFGGKTPAAVTVVDEAFFQTPSKNIFCALTSTSVRCDIARKTWQPSAKPADCELDWGGGLFLDATGPAGLTCAGDTLIGATTETLAYGRAMQAGTIECESAAEGLTCRSEQTGHGFTLAAARYTTF